MSLPRKKQAEIERVFKRVQEGMIEFDSIWDKVRKATTPNLKEKYEGDLKKEIKKLQRYREQIKSWASQSEITDKRPLLEARKSIERQMERFKVLEKESKTKKYSKEGLAQSGKTKKADPREAVYHWIGEKQDELREQLEEFEEQYEAATASGGKRKSKAKSEQLVTLDHWISRHNWHLDQLNAVKSRLEKKEISIKQANRIEEDLDYYISDNQEPGFVEDEFLYEAIDEDDSEEEEEKEEEDSEPEPEPEPPKKSKHQSDTTSRGKKDLKNSKAGNGKASSSSNTKSGKSSSRGGSATSKGSNSSSTDKKKQASDDKSLSKKGGGDKKATKLSSSSSTLTKSKSSASSSSAKGGDRKSESAKVEAAKKVKSVGGGEWNNRGGQSSTSSTSQAPPPIWGTAAQGGGRGGQTLATMLKKQEEMRAAAAAAAMAHQKQIAVRQRAAAAQQQQQQQEEGKATQRGIGMPGVGGRQSSMGALMGGDSQRQGGSSSHGGLAQVPLHHSKSTGTGSRYVGDSSGGGAGGVPPGVIGLMGRSAANGNRTTLTGGTSSSSSSGPSCNSQRVLADGIPGVVGAAVGGSISRDLRGDPTAERNVGGAASLSVLGKKNITQRYLKNLDMLDSSRRNMPGSVDTERPKQYVPGNPYRTPSCFPDLPAPVFDSPNFFSKFDTDTLFFIFYFQQGTQHQYLAARELKKQSWRYHKKFLTWFQRHNDPKFKNEDYEQGTYVFFDYESGWCKRIKSDFTFEYCHLEDELRI